MNKILKYQFGFFFALAIFNIFYYYFGNSLPDNSFVITNGSAEISILSYYFSSFVAYISFYVGPWIVVPFFVFAFVYSFILAKRDVDLDIIVSSVVSIFFFCLTFLVVPQLLGTGLYELTSSIFSTYAIFFSTLFFGFLMFYLCMRGSFLVFMSNANKAFETLGKSLINNSSKAILIGYNQAKSTKNSLGSVNIHKKAIGLLKDNKIKKLDLSNLKKSSKEEEKPNITQITPRVVTQTIDKPVVSSVDSTAMNISSPELVENIKEPLHSDSIEMNVDGQTQDKAPEAVAPRPSKRIPDVAFKSSDLIDCIVAKESSSKVVAPDNIYFDTIIDAIESKLIEFKIPSKVINVLKGPVVDTFELELGEGVRLSKVKNVSEDIGLALNGVPIRVVYPLRGRPTVGIEVPRNPREFIFLDEVLRSKSFNDSQYRLPVAMGKDAFGEVKIVDLAAMPHMLVAGATGAGKSVFINALLVSLIIKKTPKELKLILIDPKQLELATFQDLPHLMLPVVTDPTSASIALLWACQEMDRRYTILKDLGVKNLDGFNKKVKTANIHQLSKINHHYEGSKDEGYELPFIVIVIDEFADLILTKMGKEIEVNVNRLAAKARAAGIHLVLATQRPSTDVITGVVKANFPTRIAFRVTTGIDSRTILDQYGAEKLLGRGDMLYKHGVDLIRLHSSFVEEDEVEILVAKLSEIPCEYNSEAVEFLENGGPDEDGEQNGEVRTYLSGSTEDPVYEEAVKIVLEKGSASASMLQRALRVGYNRAANIIEEMERNGFVGPAQGSKPRKVLGRSE